MVQGLRASEADLFTKVPSALRSNIIASVGFHLLASTEPTSWALSAKLAMSLPATNHAIHAGCIDDSAVAKQTSKSVICGVAEKTILNVGPKTFVEVWTTLVPSVIKAATESEDTAMAVLLENFPVRADVEAMLLMGELLKSKLDSTRVSSELKGKAMRLKKILPAVTARIKAHFQSTNRSSYNNAKDVWEHAGAMFPSGAVPDADDYEESMTEHVEKIKTIIAKLNELVANARSEDEAAAQQGAGRYGSPLL